MQTHSVVQSDLLSSYVAHTELDRAMNSIVKFEMNPSASYLLLQRDSDKSSCSVDQPNLSQTACPVKHSTCATAQLGPDDSTVGMFSFRQIIPVPKALERSQLLMPRSSRYHHIKWIRKWIWTKKWKPRILAPLSNEPWNAHGRLHVHPNLVSKEKRIPKKTRHVHLVDDIWTCNACMAIYGNPDDVRKLEAWNKCSECFNPFHDSFVCGIERDSRWW